MPSLAWVVGGALSAAPVTWEAPEAATAALAEALGETDLALGKVPEDPTLRGAHAFLGALAVGESLAAAGVHPSEVAHHGLGAWAAGVWAGVWRPEEAARGLGAQLRAQRATSGQRMVALRRGEAEVAPVLERHPGAFLAVVNGPEAVVVGGAVEAVGAVCEALGEGPAVSVAEGHALHGPSAAPVAEAVAEALAGLTPRAPTVGWRGGRPQDRGWWSARLLQTFRFADVLPESNTLVEVSARPVMVGLLRRALGREAARARTFVVAHHPDRPEAARLEALDVLWRRGASVDWPRVCATGHRVPLPQEPWTPARHWISDPRWEAGAVASRPVSRRPDESAAPPPADVEGVVRGTVAELLGLSDEELDLHRPLAWQGFDSVLATELVEVLKARHGLELSLDSGGERSADRGARGGAAPGVSPSVGSVGSSSM